MRPSAIHADVERYYTARFHEHGASARGVDWKSEESQVVRFEQLARILPASATTASINDVGCGYGALVSFLKNCGFQGTYRGYDLSERMLEHARRAFLGESWVEFRAGTALARADYTVASGIFNVRLTHADDTWRPYIWETIDSMVQASRSGVAFNMLTTLSDAEMRRADLYYEDPCVALQTCIDRYGRHVALLHDYGLWEFTVLVRLP